MQTIINHSLRKKLKLSLKEYTILDSIYQTSHLKKRKVLPREMADVFDITNNSVYHIVNKLIKYGYLERNPFNKNITVTEITKLTFFKN